MHPASSTLPRLRPSQAKAWCAVQGDLNCCNSMGALEMHQRLEQLKRRIHRVHLYSQGEPTARCAGPPTHTSPPGHSGLSKPARSVRTPGGPHTVWVGSKSVFTWGQVRVELEGGRVHCHIGNATEEEASLLTPPMWWVTSLSPRMPWTEELCFPLGNPLSLCPLSGSLPFCLCVLDGCSEAVMRFGPGPWVCPCSGLYNGGERLCCASEALAHLGGGGGSPTALFHPTADPHSTCSSHDRLPRYSVQLLSHVRLFATP